MHTVLLLLLIAARASNGLDSVCDATQNESTPTCYGALGGPVYLQLMRNGTGHDLKLYSEHSIVFTFRKSKSVLHKEVNTSFRQRWQFIPANGTLIIHRAERRDSGRYRVEFHESSTGRIVRYYTLQLIMEAPVSEVDLSVRSLRCSSNGDSPQFTWFLDGRSLSEADADLSSNNQTVLLRGNVTGELTCIVMNHVSRANTTITEELCSDPTPLKCLCPGVSPVFISLWLTQIIILTSLLVGGYYLYIRNKSLHTADELKNQEVELSPTSMSPRRTQEEVKMH